MIEIEQFTFNSFQENTYLLIDPSSRDCIVIDPGCSNSSEEGELVSFIEEKQLQPVRLINTHCHIDHVLGNKFISEKYHLSLESHRLEIPVLASGTQVSQMYGIPYKESPEISIFHEEGQSIQLGQTQIEFLLTPGHSPGSICLVSKKEKWVIGGDVLFLGSIGRTDLPGGNYDTLMGSIISKLMPLEDEVVVYPGHGPTTTIGNERTTNPFITTY